MTITASDLVGLARQINEEHTACETSYGHALSHAFEAGRLLIEAKERVGHGRFMDWVRDSVAFSHDTADNYMRLARNSEKLGAANSERVRNMSIREALRQIAPPRPPKPTAEDAASLLRGAGGSIPKPSGERPGGTAVGRAEPREGVATPSQPETHRPSGAGNAVVVSEWDARGENRYQRARSLWQQIGHALDEGHDGHLSRYAIAETFRMAQQDARELMEVLSDLAFGFER